jgi:diacylglycerol kinase family enzyme
MRLVPFLRLMASMFRSGQRFRTSRHAFERGGFAELELRADPPVPYQVDGDHLGDVDRLVFRHEPGAIHLVRPAAPSAPTDRTDARQQPDPSS